MPQPSREGLRQEAQVVNVYVAAAVATETTTAPTTVSTPATALAAAAAAAADSAHHTPAEGGGGGADVIPAGRIVSHDLVFINSDLWPYMDSFFQTTNITR